MKKRILSFALAVLMIVACVPAVALSSSADDIIWRNVAEGKSVVDGRGYGVSNLTDGSTSGYHDLGHWRPESGTNDPESAYPLAETTCYVEIDLGEAYDIGKLEVYNLHQNKYRF